MLRAFTDIRGDERGPAWAAFVVLLGITAAHALTETARDALFLARLPPARLAWVYLAIALFALVPFLRNGRGRRSPSRRSLAGWLAAAAVVDIGFWFATAEPSTFTLFALYTWSGVFVSLVVVRFWIITGGLFGIRQAKRLFAFIGTGSVLGAIAGSALASILADRYPPRHILLAAAATLLATAVATAVRLPRRAPAEPMEPAAAAVQTSELARALKAVWSRPYLKRVAAIVALSTLALTLADFLFKSAVAENIAPADLGSFFAGTYVILNILSLIVQVFAVSRLVRTLSVNRVLSVLPALVILTTVGIAAGGGLAAAVALKAVDGSLRHSLHRTAIEVLYVPLTGAMRAQVKGVIDVLCQRGGQALASLLILAASLVGGSQLICAVAVIGLAATWIRIATTLEAHYLDLFRENLSELAMQTRLDFPEMDLASLETLLRSLNSADDSEVVAAIDLFAEQERLALIPALVLFHPSRRVVIRALELFTLAGRQDHLAIVGRLLDHDDAEVRAAALRAHSWSFGPRPDLYARLQNDPSPIVRATALVGLASYSGGADAARARQALADRAVAGARDERVAVARAIRYSPGQGYEEILLELGRSPEIDVRLAVIRAMREVLAAPFIPMLLEMLATRALRREAQATLAAFGAEGLRHLDETLGDDAAEIDLRLHAARTIGFFPPHDAAAVLQRHLAREPDVGLKYLIVRALGRCRVIDPTVALDGAILVAALETTLREAFVLVDWKLGLRRGVAADRSRASAVYELIDALIAERELLAHERLFRIIGLIHPREDARSLHRGVRSARRSVRDSSRELLEHLFDPPVEGPLLALVDETGDADRLARAGRYGVASDRGRDYSGLLAGLLEHGDTGLRCLVLYHIRELGLVRLRGAVKRLVSDRADVVRVAAERSLDALAETAAGDPRQELPRSPSG